MQRHNRTLVWCYLLTMGIIGQTHAQSVGSILAWGNSGSGQCNIPAPNTGFVAIAGGAAHSLGLLIDGSIVAFGGNGNGQCNVPEPNGGFIAVAGGYDHSLGLKANGSIVAWGSNEQGQCNVPTQNSEFTALAGGRYHSLGLNANGSIVAWGGNSSGQCNVPEPNAGFIALAAGQFHSLGLKANGSIVAWGANEQGQCNVPAPNTGFIELAGGGGHSLGLKADGSIVTWGLNIWGQCNVPAPNTGFIALAGGNVHSLGLKTDGSIVAWGYNGSGQSNVPASNMGFIALAGGTLHSLGLKAAVLHSESFDHDGDLASGWSVQSNSAVLTTPWTSILESGDDYAIQTSQVAFSTPRTEWLISPIYNLTGYQDIELGYTHSYTHAGSTATVKYSTNGGVSWQNLTSYSTTTSGNIVTNIASWANGQANVRFAFVFTGNFNVGGASWRVDDYFLDGIRTAPTASMPHPSQPPVAWGSLTGDVGCRWQHPLGVSGSALEVRIDANGDGDYFDGGAESWSIIADLADSASSSFTTPVTYQVAGSHLCYELRARSGLGKWGYSGNSNAEGIQDDWYVDIEVNVDTTPPAFACPIPTDQPTPAWVPTLSPQVGITISDAGSGVDASTLAWRIDLDRNGSYSGPAEDWQAIAGYDSAPQIQVLQTATLPADGEYLVEFRAKDLAGSGPSTSGNIVVRVDATPPTASTLFVSGSGLNSVTLMFSPTLDEHFTRYEIRCSTDTLVDESDQLWTDAQDPNLTQIGTYQTTVTGLSVGTAWYFRLWAVDLAGNRSASSNLVRRVTEGSQVSPLADLRAELQGTDILLSWTAPTTDIYGQSPVAIEEYQVHSSVDARFTPNASTLIGTTPSTAYLVANPGGDIKAFLRVVVVGAGPQILMTNAATVWGTCNQGQCNIPQPNIEFTSIAAGGAHVLGLKENGMIIAWGDNYYGQINVPQPNQDFAKVSAAGNNSLALKQDGSLVAWGDNYSGQNNIPQPNSNFIDISAGQGFSVGIRSDGSIVSWGSMSYTPNPNSGFIDVEAGDYNVIALKNDGSVVIWGSCGSGECNLPNPNSGIIDISAGEHISAIVRNDGSITVWGHNGFGQCNVPSPNSGFTSVTAGDGFCVGIKQDGTPVGWGYSQDGRLPQQIPGYIEVDLGDSFTIGIHPVCRIN
jgi:alpha-tubulin suppressor-like RCC1 family protein